MSACLNEELRQSELYGETVRECGIRVDEYETMILKNSSLSMYLSQIRPVMYPRSLREGRYVAYLP